MPSSRRFPSTLRNIVRVAQQHVAAADAARAAGHHREGVAQALAALALAEQAASPSVEAAALCALVINQYRLGDSRAAVEHGQRALVLLRRQRDAAPKTRLLCTLVLACSDMGRYTDSLAYAAAAIEAARRCDDESLLSWALNRASVAYHEMGDAARAEPLMLEALAVARRISGAEEMFSALNNLCDNLLTVAKSQPAGAAAILIERAVKYGDEALKLAVASGNAHRECVILNNLSAAYVASGRPDMALPLVERQEILAATQGYRSMALAATVCRASLVRSAGRTEEAIGLLDQVRSVADPTDDRVLIRAVEESLYQAHKASGNYERALYYHEALLPLEREQMQQRADRQARLAMDRIEIENLKMLVETARNDAGSARQHATRLESENHELASRAIELGRYALQDPLTGLANRRQLDQELPRLFLQAVDTSLPLSLAVLDLDHFKQVNDRFGHATGDAVLRAVGAHLAQGVRAGDLVARAGGEEFLIVLPDAPLDVATDICERLRASLCALPWANIAAGLAVTVSIGVADRRPEGDLQELLTRADTSLYVAKGRGRNRVVASPAAL